MWYLVSCKAHVRTYVELDEIGAVIAKLPEETLSYLCDRDVCDICEMTKLPPFSLVVISQEAKASTAPASQIEPFQ